MFALICSKTVALAISLAPSGPLEQFRKLPTPEAMHQEITSRLVANYRKLLSTATKGRKQLEEHPDPQVRESQLALAGWLKEKEAYYQRRIE